MTYLSRKTRHVSPRRATAKLWMERLEERQLLSGFGPEDGAYIVENRANGRYWDVKIQPGDQAIVAAGLAGVLPDGTRSNFGVERYYWDGNVDPTYGNAGLASPPLGPNQTASALFLQPDGKAVIAGQVTIAGGTQLGLAQLNLDGSPDATFGSRGWTGSNVQPGVDMPYAVGLQSTGKIVVAGYSDSTTVVSTLTQSALVARFKNDGAIDSGKGAFGQIGQGKATGYTLTSYGVKFQDYLDVAVQSDDRLVAVGFFDTLGGDHRLVVARYTASGTLDNTFNGTGYSVFLPAGISVAVGHSVALQPDGKIVVTGSCTGTDGAWDMLVARYSLNGTLDTSFGGGSGYVRLDIDGTTSSTQESGGGVAIQPDGKIVVAGNESPAIAGASGNVLVARLNSNGTMDGTFGTGGFKLGAPLPNTGYHSFSVNSVALQSNGSIIVAGYDSWDSTAHPLLMRFFPTTASPLLAAAPIATDAPTLPATPTTLILGVLSPSMEPSLADLAAELIQSGAKRSRNLLHI